MDKDTLVHKYLHQTLTDKERIELEQLLENDPAFKATFEFEKDLQVALIDTGKEDLKQQFVDFENQQYEEQSQTSHPSFLRYAVAACVIIGLSIFASKYFVNTTNSDNLFAQNFVAYRNIVQPIERGSGLETTLEEAFFNYEMKNYEAAISGFKVEFSETKKPYFLFYMANAYLALGDTKQAIPLLEEHQRSKDEFYEKSQWYLALAYLKEKEKEKTNTLLQEISNNQGYHYKEANVLLKAIR